MNLMIYKDYSARIEYSDEDACFIGHVAGIRDVVGFHGEPQVLGWWSSEAEFMQ